MTREDTRSPGPWPAAAARAPQPKGVEGAEGRRSASPGGFLGVQLGTTGRRGLLTGTRASFIGDGLW